MTAQRELGARRFRRERRHWRNRQLRRVAGRKSGRFQICLLTLLGAGSVAWAVQSGIWARGLSGFTLIRRDETVAVEWVREPTQDGAPGGRVYGVRLRPETLEIQFYHRQQIMEPQT